MANTEVGAGYVSVFPKLDPGFKKTLAKSIDGKKMGASLGKDLAGGLTKALAGAGIAAGVGKILKDSLDSYASYEQLVGGVDKLYKGASEKVQKYAAEAYKNVGMSANDYMETATSFSAALVTSLGGDVNKAADQTEVAMEAMADNVNVFGSSFEDVQNAFKGLTSSPAA